MPKFLFFFYTLRHLQYFEVKLLYLKRYDIIYKEGETPNYIKRLKINQSSQIYTIVNT